MLLRRITAHIKEQNWFAVAIDFVIVVAGILIAFQITNWNEARSDRLGEAQILRDIATDIEADLQMYDSAIDSSLLRIATVNYIFEKAPHAGFSNADENLKYFSLGQNWSRDVEENMRSESFAKDSDFEEYAADQKNRLWSFAVLVGNAEINSTALDALVNSGELDILRNKEIVQQLQQYRLITAALEKSQDTTYRPARNDAVAIGHKFGLSVFSVVDENDLLKLVGEEQELAATLQSHAGWATAHYLQLASANQAAKTLLQEIRAELGEKLTNKSGVSE